MGQFLTPGVWVSCPWDCGFIESFSRESQDRIFCPRCGRSRYERTTLKKREIKTFLAGKLKRRRLRVPRWTWREIVYPIRHFFQRAT